MNFLLEYLAYWSVRFFGFFLRLLPLGAALAVGRFIGVLGYWCDVRHRTQAYANLKTAFASTKSPREIKTITKKLFQNYGQSLVELLRLPLLTKENFKKFVRIEGREHVEEALKQNKGLILLVMHFGSWEVGSLSFAMLGGTYKVIVKPQKRFKKLDELLNSYRSCRGSVVISRGLGTREAIKGLKNNEIIALGGDQGGRDGVLVPFFGRPASMSVGALRMAAKLGTPVCFAVIIREPRGRHRLVIHPPMPLETREDADQSLAVNLGKFTELMEYYITRYPEEYMWFYKIWKYSDESHVLILNDGRTGHLRQSQAVAAALESALAERNIRTRIRTVDVVFKNRWAGSMLSLLAFLSIPAFTPGRLGFLKFLLTEQSFKELMSLKAEFVVSCGSAAAATNYFVSLEHHAKSIGILKPGLLSFRKFRLLILPKHDGYSSREGRNAVAITDGAPNLVNPGYLDRQMELFSTRFPSLQYSGKIKIGVLLGGGTKSEPLADSVVRMLINQLKEISQELGADLLITTSRRTPVRVEDFLQREFKNYPRCPALILANQANIPEAVGGILGFSDVLVVSGDSISMVSEAASSGKTTIVFSSRDEENLENKQNRFVARLNDQGYVLSSSPKNIGAMIRDAAKNKIKTKCLNDQDVLLEAARKII